MQLSLQTFNSLVQNMAAAVQAAASQLLDLTVGSATRALLEANASIALWMQWLILQVLQSTRAATSTGGDLDSWMADMTLTRLPAVAAMGSVTFSRFTPLAPALVPVGALVRTADGSQTFAVTTDITNPNWLAASNGYLLAAGVGSLTVAVVAQVAGSAGNVQAGTITLLVTAIPGIDTVVNAAPTQDGLDAETDAAFRSRFQNFVQSLSRATPLAVQYAVNSIQQGLNCVVSENADTTGNVHPGNFVVTVDDGTGNPPVSLLARASLAIEAVRPLGSTFSVQAPVVTSANVNLTIAVSTATSKTLVVPVVASAITSYINSLPIGAPLPFTRVAQVAYAASSSVINVMQLAVNGGVSDISPHPTGVIKAGTVAVD